MQKTAVITFDIKNKIEDITLPLIKSYAEKIKSDYILLKLNEDIFYQFNQFEELLQKYDRILYLSPYVLLREDLPNLFQIISYDNLGLFNEGRYTHRDLHFKAALKLYNERLVKDWKGTYYNTDVMVFSRKHRHLFKTPNLEQIPDITAYLNLRIHNTETTVEELHYDYNRIEPLDSQIGISRLNSYIINYSDAPEEIVRDIVQKDVEKWKEDSPNFEYKQNILIRLSAGLGDQIESEPVARYVRKIYPNANIYLTTHHPDAFMHLEKYNIKISDYSNWNGINDALLILENNPEPKDSINKLTQVLFHPTDFSSISMLRRILPNEEKTIKLGINPADVESIMKLTESKPKDKKSIIVHPGKWWPSKTFPKQWWQDVVDGLSEKLCVILIGKTLSENQGVLDIKCPKDGLDFRDYTTLTENITLISMSKVTLSNCSSPIHLAGAFDNWIVLIPTSKHPDHVLPWRKGTQKYKTKTLYKKLLIDDLEVRYTEFNFDTIDKLPKEKTIEEYLPDPKDVVKEIFDIYDNEQ